MAKQGGGRSDSNWEGMLKWFRPEDQSDGVLRTAHSDGTPRPAPKWRGEAKKLFMRSKPRVDYDIDDRAYDIAGTLMIPAEVQSFTPRKIQDLLDELQAYVEFIDVASVLHSDNRLHPLLLRMLFNDHVNVRAKAAELVTTMVQNNPTSQQVVLEINGLHPLLYNLNSDPNATSRTKALGAISALIRNNKPAITAFRMDGGYAELKKALDSESVMLQRDALNLIQYLLHENSSDCNIVTELEFPGIMMELASSDDAEVREAALRGLIVIIKDEEGGNNGQLVKNDDKLKQVLKKLIQGIDAMTPEDLGAAREEIQLVDSLWNACYNEPYSVGEKGLLVLPGEDAPAPDVVASKIFEPQLRALAAAEVVDGNSSEKEDPLLLGPCPPSAATLTNQSNSSSKRRKVGLVPPSAAAAATTPTVQGN